MRRVSSILLCLSVSWLALWGHPGEAGATTYRWTDPQGNLHFTDDLTTVPSSYRDRVEIVPLPETSAPSPDPVVGRRPALDDANAEDEERAVAAYEECIAAVEKARGDLEVSLSEDRDLLDRLSRGLHRTSITRHKIDLRKEREEVMARIEENEARLRADIPSMERACDRMKPFDP